MRILIDHQGLIADRWARFDGDASVLPVGVSVLLPVDEWIDRASVWRAHVGRVGVVLGATDDPLRLDTTLSQLSLIAIEFPQTTDGRGFATARQLRGRLGWRSTLRATGRISADQVPLLARYGFDEFELADAGQAAMAKRLLAQSAPASRPDVGVSPVRGWPTARADAARPANAGLTRAAHTPPLVRA